MICYVIIQYKDFFENAQQKRWQNVLFSNLGTSVHDFDSLWISYRKCAEQYSKIIGRQKG